MTENELLAWTDAGLTPEEITKENSAYMVHELPRLQAQLAHDRAAVRFYLFGHDLPNALAIAKNVEALRVSILTLQSFAKL